MGLDLHHRLSENTPLRPGDINVGGGGVSTFLRSPRKMLLEHSADMNALDNDDLSSLPGHQ